MGQVIRFPGTWYPDPLVEWMKKLGIALTRENYVAIATNDGELEWTAEHDACLPPEVRDG